MEVIGYYALFAFSISITACYLWFWPLIQEARASKIVNSFTDYPILSTIIYILISVTVAPIFIFPMFSETMATRFKRGLQSEILNPDPKI